MMLCALWLLPACRTTPQLSPRTAPPLTVPQERMDSARSVTLPTDTIKGAELYAAHTLIAHYDPKTGPDSLLAAARQMKAEIIYQYRIIPAVALRMPDSLDIHAAKARLERVKGVTQVLRDRILHLHGETPQTPVAR